MASFMVYSGTMAWFRDQAVTDDDSFQTGVVTITSSGEELVYEPTLNLTNLVPGDEMSGSFVIKNEGTVDLWYALSPDKEGTLWESGVEVEADAKYGYLAVGEERHVNYAITIGGEAPQQAAGSLRFAVDAVQVPYHLPEWIVFVNEGEDLQAAIDTAGPGYVFIVSPGSFGDITVDKPITLFGNNWNNVDGERLTESYLGKVQVSANNVVIRGFSLNGSGSQVVSGEGRNLTIANNRFVPEETTGTSDNSGLIQFNSGDLRGLFITGNHFEMPQEHQGNVSIYISGSAVLEDARIEGNTFVDTRSVLYIYTSAQARNVAINDNTLINTYHLAMRFGRLNDSEVNRNLIDGVQAGYGIGVVRSTDVFINHTHFMNFAGDVAAVNFPHEGNNNVRATNSQYTNVNILLRQSPTVPGL